MRWVTFCRLFFVSESALAALINLFVLVSVWRRRIDVNASTYRIGITVMSLSAIFQALLQCFTITIHQIHDNVYTLVQLGPTGWMSEGAREVCTVLTQTCIFLMWEWIPASCILQYLALCRPRYSNSKRLFIAYAYCLVCICVCFPFSVTFVNEKAWDRYVQDAVRMVQGIEANEQVFGYGATTNVVAENNNRTIWPFVFVASASYVWSYGAFVVTTVLIYRALRTDGVKLTKKTLAMQRRFWKMLVLQGFVPLLVCGFPVTLFIGNIIAGTSMDRSTIIMTCGIFAAPNVQGLVSLSFVRRIKKKEEPSESNSDSKNRRASSSRTATRPVESGL
ncbi:hypothetical protein PRIPAC_87405 [Pristionchus pacificus]|uniref:G protein-coupled receptor n=1 Tax=Pristionchus pacificus TaxID=54126 RepID=A0A2A6CW68_PRIPA|nr:hypothetical protein PRIPAC_87405 [Pristionchus pacificus]|eukprot:PDM82435.1 G protein-coupled receptor [Pristionchus pacificus]